MLRTFTLQLKPTAKQRIALNGILMISCDLYNAAIQERRDAWRIRRVNIGLYDQQKELTELNREIGLDGMAVDIAREPLRRVDRAFKAFFRRYKSGEKPGYPRFRAKDRYDSFTFNLPKVVDGRLKIPNLGYIRVKGGRPIQGSPRIVTVKRTSKRWKASILCDIGAAPEKVAVSKAVGIDLGLTQFITLSDGSAVANPRWAKKEAFRIARASQQLALKKKGSKNRAKAKESLRRAHQRLVDQRRNFTHHVSKALVQDFDLIAYEDLKIARMAHGHLAKSIMDAAWGELLWQLTYKAESAGKYTVAVNPNGTTQKCSGCGTKVPKKLSERTHMCPSCGLKLGRDHNAAINVLLRSGRALRA